jgi:hypothetical protein
VIDKIGLEIGDDGRHKLYSTREDHEGASGISMTLANRAVLRWTIPADDRATGFHHQVIDWEVNVHRQGEAARKIVVVSNLAAMTEQDSDAAEKVWMELVKERALLSAECTEDEGEQEATWC